MEYTELNIIQKNRMKQICTNSYTMEWENPEFMDSLMGKLPEIIITDKDRNITNELVELRKSLLSLTTTPPFCKFIHRYCVSYPFRKKRTGSMQNA